MLNWELPLNPETPVDCESLADFLRILEYRDVAVLDQKLIGVRGIEMRKMLAQELRTWRPSFGCDPRRHLHTTEISVYPDKLKVDCRIQSWFSLGTKDDTGVFEAEIKMLLEFLQSGKFSDSPLQEAQHFRHGSDRRTMLMLVSVSVGVVLLILAALVSRSA